MKAIRIRSSINETATIPGSKSITHRALIAAALADGESLLKGSLSCEDTLYTVNGLRELGARIVANENNMKVIGTGGRFEHASGIRSIYLGNSGTSYRLLLSTVSLAKGRYILNCTPRMQQRPVGELVKALNKLGAKATCTAKEEFPPVYINTKGIRGGRVELRGEQSSQFVSSLLLAAPYAEKDTEIQISGALISRPYVDITIDVMRRFGIQVHREGYRSFKIPGGQRYASCNISIEGDVSNASYFWAAAAVTGGTVTTRNINPYNTRQGDIAFLDILEQMGSRVEREKDQVTIHGGALSGIEVDMNEMPDMVPTLAAVALFARGKTVVRNVQHLRHKESDRLSSIVLEWSRLGGKVEELPDGLIIHGGQPLSGIPVDPHDDHRMAMSLAVVGLKVPGVVIANEGCVKKSFPQFWQLWDKLQ